MKFKIGDKVCYLLNSDPPGATSIPGTIVATDYNSYNILWDNGYEGQGYIDYELIKLEDPNDIMKDLL